MADIEEKFGNHRIGDRGIPVFYGMVDKDPLFLYGQIQS
jgi:hypothetical protein